MFEFLCSLEQWLWASIQMEACADVTMYALDFLQGTSTVESSSRTPTTLSGSKSNKRKRVKENIAQLANEGGEGVNFKRTSLDAVRRSLNSTVINTSSDNVTILAGEFVLCSVLFMLECRILLCYLTPDQFEFL